MFLILMERVVFGLDGFIRDHQMGNQIRLFCFGLNIAVFWGDKDPDGNGYEIFFGLRKMNEVL